LWWEVLVSAAHKEFLSLPAKGLTSFDQWRMWASGIYVLLCFWHPTELAQRLWDTRIGCGTFGKIGGVCHPIEQVFGTTTDLPWGFVLRLAKVEAITLNGQHLHDNETMVAHDWHWEPLLVIQSNDSFWTRYFGIFLDRTACDKYY
jgi:hypothetical protein